MSAGHRLGVLVGGVHADGVDAGDLVDRRLGAPEVDLGRPRVADAADDVAGVLRGDLLAERLVLLPRGGERVAELVEEALVVPDDVLREVVAQAVDVAVDGGRREGALGEAVEDVVARRGPC